MNTLNTQFGSLSDMDEITELRDRIKSRRLERELSQSELARQCDVKPSAINHLESGRQRSLSGELLLKMSRALWVMPDWLAHGKGHKLPRGLLDTAEMHGVAPGEALLNYTEMQASAKFSDVEPPIPIKRFAPLISSVRAGTWDEAVDTFEPGDAEDWLPCPKNCSANTYCLRVKGDSMTSPTGRSYPEGTIIFVDPEKKAPTSGDRIVAKLSGSPEVTFKVFIQEAGRIWLKPLNPQYPPIFEEFKVLGTVIGAFID